MSKIKIGRVLITEDDETLIVKDIRLVTFRNYGQTRVWIDEWQVIDPGEEFSIGVDVGDTLSHEFAIRFIQLGAASNELGLRATGNAPSTDEPLVYPGNRLHVTILKPIGDG